MVFQGSRAKIHPPPEEKVDPVKVKRTMAALTKPPKSDPPKGNYDRIIGKEFAEAERSRSTVSDQRLKEQRAGKQIAQLGEQAKQSCPPLKVPSDNVANDPRMVPGYSILPITCPTMYIMISWRCRYKDTSMGSLSSKMKDLYQR